MWNEEEAVYGPEFDVLSMNMGNFYPVLSNFVYENVENSKLCPEKTYI